MHDHRGLDVRFGGPHAGAAEPDAAAKRRAPCAELEGPETPRLDSFQHGVERSVCVTAWYFDRLFGTLPEDRIVETRNTHGRRRAGVEWDERAREMP